MDWGYRMSRLSKARPDKLLRIAAHHDEFAYMLWKMEYGTGNKPNNRFNIIDADKDGIMDIDYGYKTIEKENGRYEQTFGIFRYRW